MNKLTAIVLHSIKYGDTSSIVYAYTREQGKVSVMVKGVRSPKAKHQAALLQPLSLLSIVVARPRKTSSMLVATEIKIFCPLGNLPFDMYKRSIALFMGELLYRFVREEESNTALFDYLIAQVLELDQHEGAVANFHLRFVARLASHLGFAPGNRYHRQQAGYFDLKLGMFVPTPPGHVSYLDTEGSRLLACLLASDHEEHHPSHMAPPLAITRQQRHALLAALLEYFCIHLGITITVRSLQVLEEVFD